jgi:hypothetical protein
MNEKKLPEKAAFSAISGLTSGSCSPTKKYYTPALYSN